MKTHFLKIFLLGIAFISPVFSGEYVVDRNADNSVKFISTAVWEDFEGVTPFIDGYVYWEGEKLTNKSELYFEVELNTVETGNGKRDRDMRDDYLHTNRYPYTHYTGKIIEAVDSTDTILKIKSSGTMYIHGVEKALIIDAIMIKQNQGFKLETHFKVKLSDFNIKIPKLMIFKVNEEIRLELSFFVSKI